MGKIIKYLITFFESNNETSSRRLIFITSSLGLFLMTSGTLIYFLIKGKYELSVSLLESFGFFSLSTGGLVTVDIFKKKIKKIDEKNN